MLRRTCYDTVGLFDPLLMQLPDLDMWVRLCGKFEIQILPEQLTAFRILNHERNVSAPTREKMARHAWEITTVLERYAALTEQDLRQIFEKNVMDDSRHGAQVVLALEAIKLGRPGYTQFGLTLLRDCLRRDNRSFSTIEYFKLVGEIDPLAVQFSGKEHRILAKSRLWAVLKGCVRWLRAT